MNKSLSLRINIIIIIVITSLLTVFGVYDFHTAKQQRIEHLKQRVDEYSSQLAMIIANTVWNMDSKETTENIFIAMKSNYIHSVIFRDSSIPKQSKMNIAEPWLAINGMTRDKNWNAVATTTPPEKPEGAFVFTKALKHETSLLGELEVIVTTKFLLEELKDEAILWLIKMGCITLVIAITLIYLIKFNVTRPILSIIDEFKEVEKGNYEAGNITQREDELGTLSSRFSYLRQTVKEKINDLEYANNESEELRNYLNNIINSMSSMIICVNSSGRITRWNHQAEIQTGKTAEELYNSELQTILPHLSDEVEEIKKVLTSNKEHHISKHVSICNDTTKHEDIAVYPLSDTQSKGAVLRIDDVTDKVKLEQVLIQSEKINSVAGLAAGMAHEINNPLAIMCQGLQNIERRLNPELKMNIEAAKQFDIDLDVMQKFIEQRKIPKFLTGCLEAVDRSAKIVKNMLLFSRKSNSEQNLTNIIELMDHTIELGTTDYDMKKKYDFKFVELTKEYETELPDIRCCRDEIEQVLLNLFKNAMQAMEEVECKNFKPLFHIRIKKELSFVRIEIEDNGPGIPDKIKNRIFEPFFTSKPVGVGTGLGLSVSYMIITQNHNGVFEVESLENKYTKFIIKLPV